MKETTAFDIREILLRKVDKDKQLFEEESIVIKAFTIGVDDDESPAVDGRAKYIWVRESGLNGAVHQVFNPDSIPLLTNFPCLITHSPKEPYRWEIYGTDWDAVYNFPSFEDQNFGLGDHAPNHEWSDYYPGTDVVNVYPRAITPLRTYSGVGLTIHVWAHRYPYNGSLVEYSGIAGLSLSSHQPGSGSAVSVLVYLDKITNTIKTVAGTIIGDGATLPPYPTIPDNAILSAIVRIDGDQAAIAEVDIRDMRMALTESEITEIAGSTTVTINQLAALEAQFDLWFSMHVLVGH